MVKISPLLTPSLSILFSSRLSSTFCRKSDHPAAFQSSFHRDAGVDVLTVMTGKTFNPLFIETLMSRSKKVVLVLAFNPLFIETRDLAEHHPHVRDCPFNPLFIETRDDHLPLNWRSHVFQSSFHRDWVQWRVRCRRLLHFQSSFHRDIDIAIRYRDPSRLFQSSFHRDTIVNDLTDVFGMKPFQSSFHRDAYLGGRLLPGRQYLSILFSSRLIIR